MTDYIERKSIEAKEIALDEDFNEDEIYADSDNAILKDFLKDNYPYILDEIECEGYIIEEPLCQYFHEVVYDSKVVGFYTYEYISDIMERRLCINEFYVVPEYRGKMIFINTLKDLIAHSRYDGVLLRNPTRHIINILLENGLATRFSKNLVRTGLKLATRINKLIKNKKLNRLYYDIDDEVAKMTYLGNIYDMNLDSIVFNDTLEILTPHDDIICLSNPRGCDYQRYHLAKKIRNVDKKYLRSTYKTIIKSWDELEEFQKSVDNQFLEDNGIDMYLGSLEKPDPTVQALMDDGELTAGELEVIRKKIEKALQHNEITPQNVMTRFYYHVDYPDSDAPTTGHRKSGHCPYCNSPDIEKGTCCNCGYNLFDKKIEQIQEELKDTIDPETGLYKSLVETIERRGLDSKEVIADQIEISACQLLNFLNQYSDYPSLPDFDDNNEVSEEKYVKFLHENGYIELKENTNTNDENEFLEMLKQTGGLPSTRAYKAHMHREYRYKITKKGRRYYNKNKIANLYMDNIINLPYYQFKHLYQENKDTLNEDELLREYIRQVETEAIEDENLTRYNDVCLTRIKIAKDKEDDKKLLTYMIKSLICRLNYYRLSIEEDNFTQTPVDVYNEVFLLQCQDRIDHDDYKKLFEKAYNNIEIDKLKTNKKELYKDIEDILKSNDISTTNRQLAIKYNDV